MRDYSFHSIPFHSKATSTTTKATEHPPLQQSTPPRRQQQLQKTQIRPNRRSHRDDYEESEEKKQDPILTPSGVVASRKQQQLNDCASSASTAMTARESPSPPLHSSANSATNPTTTVVTVVPKPQRRSNLPLYSSPPQQSQQQQQQPQPIRVSSIPPPYATRSSPNRPSGSRNNGTSSSSNARSQSSPTDSTPNPTQQPKEQQLQLDQALQESNAKYEASQEALAKSDALISELRSTVRQLKRQLQPQPKQSEGVHTSSTGDFADLDHASASAAACDARVGELQVQLDRAHAQLITADMVRKELEDTLEAEQYQWDLREQEQLRTIASLQTECASLTEELEKLQKQYQQTHSQWEKEVLELQQQLESSLKEVQQYKASQKPGVNDQSPSSQDDAMIKDLQNRLFTIEQEREELQGCLNEALKELEAVDAELQNNDLNQQGIAELRQENQRLQSVLLDEEKTLLLDPLRHLYRWLLERDGEEEDAGMIHSNKMDARALISAIRSHLENKSPMSANNHSRGIKMGDSDWAATQEQMRELESQVTVYRNDLKAREESSSELRASLKEAVALLKPLQDAVAKADREKGRLQQQVDQHKKKEQQLLQQLLQSAVSSSKDKEIKELKQQLAAKEDEVDRLHEEMESLEIEMSKVKLQIANSAVAASRSPVADAGTLNSLSKAREDLRAKRASEDNLKQLLRDAQSRYSALHEQNQEGGAVQSSLQGRLRDAEDQMDMQSPTSMETASTDVDAQFLQRMLVERDHQIQQLEGEIQAMRVALDQNEKDLDEKDREIQNSMNSATGRVKDEGNSKLRAAETRIHELQIKLDSTSHELFSTKDAERALNKSLREALGLLRPLQVHLEEAEQEKMALTKELRALRKRLGDDSSGRHRSAVEIPVDVQVKNLEDTVKELEKENSQLHDALEDMSQTLNASQLSGATGPVQKSESRLREEIVELKSRYEVTLNRLESAFEENHRLIEELKRREQDENDFLDEISMLRTKLKSSEAELESTKYQGSSGAKSDVSRAASLLSTHSVNSSRNGTGSISANAEQQQQQQQQQTRDIKMPRQQQRQQMQQQPQPQQQRSKVPYRLT